MLPLVGVVVVDGHDVQVARVAAQLRVEAAGEHVPGVELGGALPGGGVGQVGRSLGGTTWMTGSPWTKRARGSTAQTASQPAIAARTSWRFSSWSRPRAKGKIMPRWPTAHERKEISLTGV